MMQDRLSVMLDVSAVPYGRGVSRYTSNLAVALSSRLDLDLTLFGYSWRQASTLRNWMREFGSGVNKQLWHVPPRLLEKMWQHTGQPHPAKKEMVFHAWESQFPHSAKIPWVVTIHDLAYRMFPETAHPQVVQRYEHLLRMLERDKQTPIIAVSHSTREDIVNLTGLDPSRIHVVPEALPMEARYVPAQEEVAAVKRELELEKPFFLFVGTREPRKNLKNIIEAWRKVKKEYDLVLAGDPGWEEVTPEAGLHLLGYVAPQQLAALYRSAQALVFVSLYEGFGLPILEAYFHGCPVITSRVSSLPEVGGKPAVYVDPYDVEGIAEAMLALEDSNTRARKRRQADMESVLESFSWERTAAETVDVYRIAQRERT